MCELLLGAILLVLLGLLVQSERLRRVMLLRPAAPAPVKTPPVTPPLDPAGPGLSAHCGHTHHTLITDAQGLTACPDCAGRSG